MSIDYATDTILNERNATIEAAELMCACEREGTYTRSGRSIHLNDRITCALQCATRVCVRVRGTIMQSNRIDK